MGESTDDAVAEFVHYLESTPGALDEFLAWHEAAKDAGQAKKLAQQQFPKSTVLSVKKVD